MSVSFCILLLKFTQFTDLVLALFFGSYPWLFIPVEWSLFPKVGSGRVWAFTVTQFYPIWFQMAVLLECIPCNGT